MMWVHAYSIIVKTILSYLNTRLKKKEEEGKHKIIHFIFRYLAFLKTQIAGKCFSHQQDFPVTHLNTSKTFQITLESLFAHKLETRSCQHNGYQQTSVKISGLFTAFYKIKYVNISVQGCQMGLGFSVSLLLWF